MKWSNINIINYWNHIIKWLVVHIVELEYERSYQMTRERNLSACALAHTHTHFFLSSLARDCVFVWVWKNTHTTIKTI